MRLLLIEDDVQIAESLGRALRRAGDVVDIYGTARDAEQALRAVDYALVILDLGLPDRDGGTLLRAMRAQDNHTPVLVVTARDELNDRVRLLDLGADDYLVKPFSFAELLARIRVVLRRGGEVTPTILQVADLRLDPLSRTVERAGQRIDLSSKQFTLLAYLLRHAGQVVSRTMILEHVWDFEFDGLTNVVDVHINRLRNKVDRGFDRPLIHTLRGVGYVLREE
jgi:DNA-binding response OmpR family regulator